MRTRATRAVLGLVVMAWLTSCSEPLPTTRPPDSELREQIHAATGHEPTDCTDFAGSDAVIAITDTGFEPECAMVATDSTLVVENQSGEEHTFTVSDGAGGDVVRHIRVDETLAPDGEYELVVEDQLGPAIYPFWSKGHQEEGYTGTLIVGP